MLIAARLPAALLLLIATVTAAAPDGIAERDFTRAWVTEVRPGYAAPSVFVADDDLVLRDSTSVSALDPRTGIVRWRHVFTRSMPSDWIAQGGTLVAVSMGPAPKGDTTSVTGLSRADGTVRWERPGLGGAGDWRGPFGGAGPISAVPAWDAGRREVVGLAPESGAAKWTAKLPGGCDSVLSSGSAPAAVVLVARCDLGSMLLALAPETGTTRWSARVGGTANLSVLPEAVVLVHDHRLTLYHPATGRVIVERTGCWDACVATPIVDLIVLAYGAGSDEVIEAFDPARGSTRWIRRQPASAGRYTRLLVAGDRLYGVLDVGAPAVVDLIDPVSGTGRRTRLPQLGDPFSATGSLLLTAWQTGDAGQAAQVRLAAFQHHEDIVQRVSAAAWPGRSACDLLSAEDLAPLGPDYREKPDDLPSAAGCRYTGKGMEIAVRVWTEPSARLAEELFGELKDAVGGVRTSALADDDFTSGAHVRSVYVREGRTVIRVSSVYIPLRGALRAMAREAARRVRGGAVAYPPYPARWRADTTAAAPAESSDALVRLAGTSVTIHEPAGSPLTLRAYNPFNDGPTRLRQASGAAFSSAAGRYTALSPDGRWGLALSDRWSKGRDVVTLADLRTGRSRAITMPVVQPLWSAAPVWSRDGGKLLFTVRRKDDDDGGSTRVGFITMDVPSGKPVFVPTDADEDLGEFDFFWNADETGVVSSFGVEESENSDAEDPSYDTYALRFLDLSGKPTGTVENVGDPDLGMPDPYSPSRSRFVAHCPRHWGALCVSDATTGAPLVRVDLYTERLIGWYDEDHLVVWQRVGEGYQAAVVDFAGRVVGRLAESTTVREADTELFYVRRDRPAPP
ncbi:outer membrane protein assembly factor BamB family protein [Sphaerisporangium perillae]|uniref:outer membrane protein assembly factor BamB family protein n=1 Tax=Sphaerisporangium perillae TaxID=2935860 RepID=UPI00200EDD42|nr:PQQ-binding-like beta-propeller repeat protein [Sphaerisporangium perillae]